LNKQLHTWRLIHTSLVEQVPVILLYVLESTGSSPGRQGFFMAVNAKGEMEGSIGGGIMEHKFVEMVKERLRDTGYEMRDNTLKKQYHDKTAPKNQSGMICSGEQTILLFHVKASDNNTIVRIIESLEKNLHGTLQLSPSGIEFIDAVPLTDFEFDQHTETNWIYKEKTGYKQELSVIGGGHCSLALSRLMRQMDFYIRVYDDRKELKTMIENESAHEKHFVNDYSELKDLIHPGRSHYVVIMTLGYRTDNIALRTIIDKEFKFLGLLGSKNKIAKMMEEYKKEGVEPERLQRIHAPVGLSIKSQTPEEIAVSIAAEIIRVKNE